MKRITTTFIATLLTVLSATAQTYTVDVAHSKVGFSVSHLVISEVDGKFKDFEGTLKTKNGKFEGADVLFTVKANSIDTDIEQRDNHLRSEDFFYVEKYPELSFKSTSFEKIGDTYELKGLLTIRGVTKKVTFEVKYGGEVIDAYGNTRVGFSAKTTIDRTDYGVAWNAKTEHGTWTVGNEVDIELKLELIKQ